MSMNSNNYYLFENIYKLYSFEIMTEPNINQWIKTPCGRAKYAELDSKKGLFSRLRLYWFVIIATLRDWKLSSQNQIEDSES